MLGAYSNGNITSLKAMWFQIATDLVSSGAMTIETVYNDDGAGVPNYSSPGNTPSSEGMVYVFAPTLDVDADSVNQPWRLVISLTETYFDIWAVTPTQIIQTGDSFSIAKSGDNPETQSGHFSLNNYSGFENHKVNRFFSRDHEDALWSCFVDNTDAQLVPLTYLLSCGEHGLVFSMWAEGHDKAGDCFNWFVIQRSVDSNGDTVPTTKNPLFCAFSQNGGGSNDVNTIVPDGILKFVVREADVNAPTVPKSASVPKADSAAWFNPIQQVSTSENGKLVVSFPRGLNTQRYRYDTEIDMVAFASADVIAQGTEVPLTLYGGQRKYKAINANHLNNKGMRLLIQIP